MLPTIGFSLRYVSVGTGVLLGSFSEKLKLYA